MPPKLTPEQLEARKEKARVDGRRYYHENKEKLREDARRYYHENKEVIAKKSLDAYYHKGKREKMLAKFEEVRIEAETVTAELLAALEKRGVQVPPREKAGRLEERCSHAMRAAIAFLAAST